MLLDSVNKSNQFIIIHFFLRLRSFGVKPILDYSVEEDLSQEEAEEREVAATTTSALVQPGDDLPQFSVDKTFADRRYKVNSARTYFYLNEATCEKNMETFIRCLEAVANSTFGTGITAIKLTALGRPQLLVSCIIVLTSAKTLNLAKLHLLGYSAYLVEIRIISYNFSLKSKSQMLEKVIIQIVHYNFKV